MTPIIDVSDETLEELTKLNIPYAPVTLPKSKVEVVSGHYIEIPNLKLAVARKRTHQGKNWHEAHDALKQEGARMLTPPEFVEVLKYTQENAPEVYEDITAVREPWRAEWLDACFEQRQDGLYVLTQHKTNAEKLDEDTLMENRTPGISLEGWLEEPTEQGLPKSDIWEGDLFYWFPTNDSIAGFGAGSGRAVLDCNGVPSDGDSGFGVRAAKQA